MRIFHFVFLLVIFVSFVAASDDDDDDENESKGQFSDKQTGVLKNTSLGSPKSSGHTTKSYTQTKDPHGSQNPKNRSSITEEPGDSPAPKTLASGAPKSRPPTKEARKTTVADDPEDSPSPTNETRKTTVANDPEDSPAPKTLASAATKSRPPTKEVKKTTVADEPEDSPSPENKTHVTSGSTHKPAVKKSTPIGSKPSTHGNTFKTSKRPPTNSPKPILPKKGDYVLTGVVLCEREKNAWLQVDTEVSVLPNIKGNGHVYV